jgi:hypothetical protein
MRSAACETLTLHGSTTIWTPFSRTSRSEKRRAALNSFKEWLISPCQRWGGPIEEIRPGDVVWFPPGEKHWHGAAPTTAMTHMAIQEKLDGKVVDWLEKVSDEQYQA